MIHGKLSGVAYSYVRFSSARQERGDSVRRQHELRDRWLARHPDVHLVDDEEYEDLGASAFRGKHRRDDKAALRLLVSNVETGKIKSGSFLIVESLDRLTREELGDAFELVLGLVNRGIRIVQLSPVESVLQKPVDMAALMLAVVELSRGRGESQRKSDLQKPLWERKRRECREFGKAVTTMCKKWLEYRNGRFVFKPGAKALVRRIFALATAGHGCRSIAGVLNREGVPMWTGKPWYEMYVREMLRGREVLGEFQPARRGTDGKRVVDGEPVVDYYPRAVSEAEWQAAQVAVKARDRRGGRPPTKGDEVNVFQGLIHDARSGDSLHVMNRRGVRVYAPSSFVRGGRPGVTFRVDQLEPALLSALAELDPREILDDRDERPDAVAELAAKVARLDAQVKNLTDAFDDDDVIPELAEKLRAKHAERKTAVEALDRAKADAASPLSSAWGECRGLAEALEQAKNVREVRVRLKQALARIIESVWCLFLPGRENRVAAAQIWFAGGGRHREYLIAHTNADPRIAKGNQCWSVRSVASAKLPDLDLRDARQAAALEKAITKNLGKKLAET